MGVALPEGEIKSSLSLISKGLLGLSTADGKGQIHWAIQTNTFGKEGNESCGEVGVGNIIL